MMRSRSIGRPPSMTKTPQPSGREQCATSKPIKFQPTETSAEWLSGKFGTKDCVLRFRLSALNTVANWQPIVDQPVIDTPPKSSNGRYPGHASKILEPSNLNSPKPNSAKKSQFVGNLLLKKRAHQSLSSSDTSISSSCDDPADAEDDRPSDLSGSHVQKPADDSVANVCEKENHSDSSSVDVSEMPARALQIGYRFANTETRLLRRILNSHGMLEMDETREVSLMWTGAQVKTDLLRNLKPHQRVNHFPRSYELTRKDRLYKNIEKMQHLRGFKQFDFVPTTFMLPGEYRNLVACHRSSQKMPWIAKPAASSRGRGIFLVHSPEQIPQDEQVLVSRYISNPLCIDGHKCDIRLYVVVTSFDPLTIYLYEEGIVRLATVKYDKNNDNLWNPCMHLCNYSINKYHSDYIKATETCEDIGHKWTFSALLRHLRQQGSDTEELMGNIEDVIVKSILSCTQPIATACRMFVPCGNNCFELYGYDILIDDQLKPWLLEVNMSPSLGVDTPLDTKVKASVIADLLTLVGIPVIDPSIQKSSNTPKWSRYRNAAGLGKCRKASSSDVSTSNKRTSSTSNPSCSNLTQEEQRIVRHAQAQHNRKGGFIRIFPTYDSMQRYGNLLDVVTGIPMSTPAINGATALAMIVPHNYNLMLHNTLFSSGTNVEKLSDRMIQYERALSTDTVMLRSPNAHPKSVDETIRLRRLIRRHIENELELSQLQARRLFHRYLECVLARLATEPPKSSQQEKWILKFITQSETGRIKTPNFIKFPSMPQSQRIQSKDRSALVAKLLNDYIEAYHKDTEAYVDDFDVAGIIPRRDFYEFLSLAQENDLENILTLHTNITQSIPFLSSRGSFGIQVPPPIPTGSGGFLRALPAMVRTSVPNSSIENYYRSLNKLSSVSASANDVHATPSSDVGRVSVSRRSEKAMSTSVNFPTTSSAGKGMNTIKRRSVSQTAINR